MENLSGSTSRIMRRNRAECWRCLRGGRARSPGFPGYERVTKGLSPALAENLDPALRNLPFNEVPERFAYDEGEGRFRPLRQPRETTARWFEPVQKPS